MDGIYLVYFFYFVVALASANALVLMGTGCACNVWERTKKDLDADPYQYAVVVPYSTSGEAILIFLAVLLRSPVVLLAAVYREASLNSWERKKAIRLFDSNMRSAHDVLGAVSTMISGYPERAQAFLVAERGKAIARHYGAYYKDHEEIVGSGERSQVAIG